MDEQLGGKLYDKVDGLEKASILNKISYNKQYDSDSTELYTRLKGSRLRRPRPELSP